LEGGEEGYVECGTEEVAPCAELFAALDDFGHGCLNLFLERRVELVLGDEVGHGANGGELGKVVRVVVTVGVMNHLVLCGDVVAAEDEDLGTE